MITVSIVSHRHGAMVSRLVCQLMRCCPEVTEIIVTHNVPEELSAVPVAGVRYLENTEPRGFGENHNAAFRFATQPLFCVMNPDVEILENPFPGLIDVLGWHGVGIVAPLVRSSSGQIDDSIRRFPTIRSLIAKAVGLHDRRPYGEIEERAPFFAEWCAGMFMLFRKESFIHLGGFDERFFLYYEDVDICARAWLEGVQVVACPQVWVTHYARRDSHRHLFHFICHFNSLIRYFYKHAWRLPLVDG